MVGKGGIELVARWRSRLHRQVSSGLKVEAFCKREGVSSASFYRWKKRFAEGPQTEAVTGVADRSISKNPPFLPVTIRGNLAMIEIELPNHAVVRLPATIGADVLSKAIQAADLSLQEERGC